MQNDEKTRWSGQGSVSSKGTSAVRATRPIRFVATGWFISHGHVTVHRSTQSKRVRRSELPNKPDFHLQFVPKPRLHRLLRVGNHRPHIRRGGLT